MPSGYLSSTWGLCRLENYVREELALVLALGSKRASVDGDPQALDGLLEQAAQMVAAGNPHLVSGLNRRHVDRETPFFLSAL